MASKDMEIARRRIMETWRDCNISSHPTIKGDNVFFQVFTPRDPPYTKESRVGAAIATLIGNIVPDAEVIPCKIGDCAGFSIPRPVLEKVRNSLRLDKSLGENWRN